MRRLFAPITVTAAELAAPRAGDEVVPSPDAVMDRAFTLDAPPAVVWPWLAQLGKRRAGWYLPRSVERFIPPGRRAIRVLESRWQVLRVGEVIPDYGGRHETFTVHRIDAPHTLVYTSQRGRVTLSWALTLTALDRESADRVERSRLHLRLRMGPLRRPWLARTAGDFFDALTVAGLAAGLRERLDPVHPITSGG